MQKEREDLCANDALVLELLNMTGWQGYITSATSLYPNHDGEYLFLYWTDGDGRHPLFQYCAPLTTTVYDHISMLTHRRFADHETTAMRNLLKHWEWIRDRLEDYDSYDEYRDAHPYLPSLEIDEIAELLRYAGWYVVPTCLDSHEVLDVRRLSIPTYSDCYYFSFFYRTHDGSIAQCMHRVLDSLTPGEMERVGKLIMTTIDLLSMVGYDLSEDVIKEVRS